MQKPQFNQERLQQWHDYEELRLTGLFNMADIHAVQASGLSYADYRYVQNHYEELKAAYQAAEDAHIMAQAERNGH